MERNDGVEALGRMVRDEQERLLDRVQAELERQVTRDATRRSGRPRTRTVAAVAALSVAAVLALAVMAWRQPEAVSFTLDGHAVSTSEWVTTDAEHHASLEFTEGTTVLARPSSRVRVGERTAAGAIVELERGELAVSVRHRDDTRWMFEAGPYRVEVVGTRFDLAWSPTDERFELSMHDGRVWLEGPDVARRSVVAGERVLLEPDAGHTREAAPSSSEASAPVEPATTVDELRPAETVAAAARRRPTEAPRSPRGWAELARDGEYDAALAAAEAQGFDRLCARLEVDELQELGDASRFAGSVARARQAYLALRARFPESPFASRAAFDLGVVSRGPDAATWFETYLEEAPEGPLAREAMGRLLELRHRAGREADARRLARAYLERYPEGAHARLARSIESSP